MRYSLPECLVGRCTELAYVKWLGRKAVAHVLRDKKRIEGITVAGYKRAIHDAVCCGGGLDYYTGEPLDWSLISTYRNAESAAGKRKYKTQFARLPTVDHTEDEHGQPKLVICSWRVNDMKSDMTESEFRRLCARVLRLPGG